MARGPIRLPTAADVPQVNVAADPGLRIPEQDATQQALVGLGGAVQGLAGNLNLMLARRADVLQRETERQQRRRDATVATESLLAFSTRTGEEWRRLQVEGDPSDPTFLTGFNSFVKEQADALLTGLPPDISEEGRGDLRLRLMEQQASWTDSAGELHLNATRKRANDAIEGQISEWANQAYANPAHLDTFLSMAEEGLAYFDDTLTPEDERAARQKAQSAIVVSAMRGLIAVDPERAMRELQGGETISGPALVEAVIAAESAGNPAAVSPKGAIGLMQIMPDTARDVHARIYPGEPFDKARLFDPDYNRAIGEAYLREQQDHYGDDRLALAAYNAGPGKVDEWLASIGDPRKGEVSWDSFVRQIPFDETRAYVRKVTARAGSRPSILAGKWDRLDPEVRNTLINASESELRRLEAEEKQRRAEARALLLTGYDDYIAFLRAGGTPDGRYTASRLVATLGAEEGMELAGELDRAISFGQTVTAVNTATPEELAAMVARESADLERPAHFREQAQEASALMQAIGRREQALADDPAAFVIQNAQPVRRAYEAMQAAMTNPAATNETMRAATQAYAAAVAGEQERLGLEQPQIRYLTNAHADSIGLRFVQQPEGGESAAALIQGLEGQWGRQWPAVHKELVAAKALPPHALVIASGMPPGAATLLSEIATTPIEELKKGVSNEDITDLDDYVAAELQDFALTLPDQVEGSYTYSVFNDATYRLALGYVKMRGMDAASAARQAAAETVMEKYVFEDTYRVPLGINADRVAQGADAALQLLPALALPASLLGLDSRQTREAHRAAVRDGGYWVTNEDETGLVLFDGGTRTAVLIQPGPTPGPQPPRLPRPYTLTWEELATFRQRHGLPPIRRTRGSEVVRAAQGAR